MILFQAILNRRQFKILDVIYNRILKDMHRCCSIKLYQVDVHAARVLLGTASKSRGMLIIGKSYLNKNTLNLQISGLS